MFTADIVWYDHFNSSMPILLYCYGFCHMVCVIKGHRTHPMRDPETWYKLYSSLKTRWMDLPSLVQNNLFMWEHRECSHFSNLLIASNITSVGPSTLVHHAGVKSCTKFCSDVVSLGTIIANKDCNIVRKQLECWIRNEIRIRMFLKICSVI